MMSSCNLILRGTLEELSSSRARKVLATSTLAQLELKCETVASSDELWQLISSTVTSNSLPFKGNESLVLSIEFLEPSSASSSSSSMCTIGCRWQHLSSSTNMMRTIARLASTQNLFGNTALEEALVDSWISYIATSIDVPLEVVCRSRRHQRHDGSTNVENGTSADEQDEVMVSVRDDLTKACTVLERLFRQRLYQKLSTTTTTVPTTTDTTSENPLYIVGNHITCADISLALSLNLAFNLNMLKGLLDDVTTTSYPHLLDWYYTISQQDWFRMASSS